jgi:hypothetical protein
MGPGVAWWDLVLDRHVDQTLIGSTFQNAGGAAAIGRLAGAPKWPLVIRVVLSLWPLCCVILWVVALRRHGSEPAVRLLTVIMAVWLLISGGPHADNRLRSPIVPAMSILAAIALIPARTRKDDARPGTTW